MHLKKESVRMLWKEGILFAIIILIIYKLITNLQPIFDHFSNFFAVISPFIVGGIAAYFLSRPVDQVERLIKRTNKSFFVKRARRFAVLAVFLMVAVVVSLVVSYGIPIIVSNVIDLTNQLGNYSRTIVTFGTELIKDLEKSNNWLLSFISSEELMKTISETFPVKGALSQLGMQAISIVNYIISMTSGIINAFISIIICLYSLIFKESILIFFNRVAKAFIPTVRLDAIKSYMYKSNDIFYRFIAAQFLDACVLGILATIILYVLGVQYALTLGIILGISNMIPYFGSMFASILTAVVTFFTGGIQLALLTALSLLILQQIDGNFIGPRIMGDALKLNPMLIILSITIGGAYFGIIGMFLSVPIAAMLKLFINDFLTIREKKLQEREAANFKSTE